MSNSNSISSPKWKKPGDVMKKLHLRRKKPLLRSFSTSCIAEDASPATKYCTRQSKNPFAKTQENKDSCQVNKKRILSIDMETNSDDPTDSKDLGSSILNFIDKANEDNEVDFVYLNEDSFIGLNNMISNKEELDDNVFRRQEIPVDWTIKAKVRFMSPSTFAWCTRMKTAEEAAAISRVTQCVNNEKAQLQTDADFRIELGKSLIYWQHPSIPWLSLFPRFGQDQGLISASTDESGLPEYARSSLYDSWVIAFRSVYQLLRQDMCPYFYVCSQQYTALFRAPCVNHHKQVTCLLSPTSLGFRKALQSQGIEFTTPLQRVNSSKDNDLKSENDATIRKLKNYDVLACPFPASRPGLMTGSSHSNDESLNNDKENKSTRDDDSSQEDLEEELSWKDISDNLSFRKSKSLVTATTEDGLPNTAVLVEGLANNQLLFNYLLNSKNSITTSGRQTGMPPTMLSPVAFNGATLRKLEYRAGIAKVRTESANNKLPSTHTSSLMEKRFSFDVSGPILPHHVSSILSLLDVTQSHGEYSSSFNTYSYSSSFNARTEAEVTTKSEARDCTYLNKFDLMLPPVTMRKLNALNRTYTWND